MTDSDVVYGNYEDKYGSQNPIAQWMIGQFLSSFHRNLQSVPRKDKLNICEVGCAEGELLKYTYQVFPDADYFAVDISPAEIEKAKTNCASIPIEFSIQDATNLNFANEKFDIVICCEVLEHLPDPFAGLNELIRISHSHIIVSVPNEPLWRILNIARGKYLKDFGNTPGHLNHWSIKGFQKLLNSRPEITIQNKAFPLPWQMYLLKKR